MATALAIEAGALLREALYQGAKPSSVESNGEVHALADLRAEQLIRAGLTARFPRWGMRVEEEPEHNRPPEDEAESFWLIDPNDGTSAFIKGERGASVSIALIQRGRPVLGVIYAYMGLDDQGDLFTWAQGCGPLMRNGLALAPQRAWAEAWSDAVIFVSNSADSIASAYLTALDGARFRVAPGVAYRLALAAAGEGDGATSLAGPRDFDYAAGHALLIGAGGDLIDERGRAVHYHPTQPQRLGFGFGGAAQHLERLRGLNWGPVLRREGATAHTLRRPGHADLCSDPKLLSAARAAWWGWHIGWSLFEREPELSALLPQLFDERSMTSSLRAALERCLSSHAGDWALNAQLREALHHSSAEQGQQGLERHAQLRAHPLLELLGGLLHEGSSAGTDEPLTPQAQAALTLARRALKLEREQALLRPWSPRLIGALLSARTAEMRRWGSDSARLLEATLKALTRR